MRLLDGGGTTYQPPPLKLWKLTVLSRGGTKRVVYTAATMPQLALRLLESPMDPLTLVSMEVVHDGIFAPVPA